MVAPGTPLLCPTLRTAAVDSGSALLASTSQRSLWLVRVCAWRGSWYLPDPLPPRRRDSDTWAGARGLQGNRGTGSGVCSGGRRSPCPVHPGPRLREAETQLWPRSSACSCPSGAGSSAGLPPRVHSFGCSGLRCFCWKKHPGPEGLPQSRRAVPGLQAATSAASATALHSPALIRVPEVTAVGGSRASRMRLCPPVVGLGPELGKGGEADAGRGPQGKAGLSQGPHCPVSAWLWGPSLCEVHEFTDGSGEEF